MTAAGRPAAPATKTARQARIVAILSREQVHSQEQLAGLLAQYAGLHVAQATLSRDLDELGVVRLRGADGTLVYALSGDPGGPGSRPGTGLDLTNYPERSEAPQAPSARTPTPGDPDPSAPATADSPHSAARASTSPSSAASGSSSPASGVVAGRSPGSAGHGDASSRSRDGSGSSGAPGAGTVDGTSPRAGDDAGTGGTPAVAADLAAADPGTSADRAGQPHRPGVGPVGAVSTRFTRYLKELLTSAEGSANIVVLRTPAGAAQFLASTIDHAAWPAILGTVAGDDTVLVISRDPVGGEALAAEFRHLAEGRR
jgi:transcriptional regulator of arginine metabolism